MIKQLRRMNEDFARPLGPAIPKPAPAAPQPVQIKPGIWQAPDGRLRTDFATGQSVAPAQKAAPATPLPVLPNALVGLKVGDRVRVKEGQASDFFGVGDVGRITYDSGSMYDIAFDPSPTVDDACVTWLCCYERVEAE